MLGTATGGGGGLGQFLERVWNNFANVEKGIGEVGRSRTRMQVVSFSYGIILIHLLIGYVFALYE